MMADDGEGTAPLRVGAQDRLFCLAGCETDWRTTGGDGGWHYLSKKQGSRGYVSSLGRSGSLAWGPQGDFSPAERVLGASPVLFGCISSVLLLKAFLALSWPI